MKKLNKKRIIIILVVVLLLVVIVLFSWYLKKYMNQNTNKNNTASTLLSEYDDEDPTYDLSSAINIELNGDNINVDNPNVEVTGNVVTINEGGIYVLNGNLNGSVNVDTEELVRIILKNAIIESTDGPAIYVKNADKVVITLDENTTNTLKDSSTCSDPEAIATVYSKDDLVFNGYGTLSVDGIYQDAIVSKDDLKIVSGTYTVNAMNNGIKGKDSVKIKDGNIDIVSKNDCIKSTNPEEGKGYIEIQNGILNLVADHDGIQAENYVLIENGEVTITSGGGSENSTKIGIKTDIFVRGKFMAPDNLQTEESSEDTASYKAIKAQNSIKILNGSINIKSADDSIHSNGSVEVISGNINIESGDDGIHADDNIIIDGGKINIIKSYEGIEANTITINDGEIEVVSSDDGINVAGGNDFSSINGRAGQNNFNSSSDSSLEINGGKIYIDSSGDGLDSNNTIYLNNGTIYVEGPTETGNSAIDYENEFVMKGGKIIAIGSAQMTQCISSTSTINCLNLTLSSIQSANTTFNITDLNNNEIISYTSSKEYQSVVIATSKLKTNETYNFNINGNKNTSFTISSIITSVGENFGNGTMMKPRM